MGSIWTVTPDKVRYTLKFGEVEFWIDVKSELNTGDSKRLLSAGFRTWKRKEGVDVEAIDPKWTPQQIAEKLTAQLELTVRVEEVIFEKILIWMVDWSLTDDAEVKLPRTVETLRALHPSVFELIEKEVDGHALRSKKASSTTSSETPATVTPSKT